MTDTPIYDQLVNCIGAAEEALANMAAYEHMLTQFQALVDAPLPHREPNLIRLNHTINERYARQWPHNLASY